MKNFFVFHVLFKLLQVNGKFKHRKNYKYYTLFSYLSFGTKFNLKQVRRNLLVIFSLGAP